MRNCAILKGTFLSLVFSMTILFPSILLAQKGLIAVKIEALQQKAAFDHKSSLFSVVSDQQNEKIAAQLSSYRLLDIGSTTTILREKPATLSFSIPAENGRNPFRLLLYKEDISPNGFTLRTSDNKIYEPASIIHYRGIVEGDKNSIAAISVSADEVAGIISNDQGNYVLGKIKDANGKHIFYNSRNLKEKPVFGCGTNTSIPLEPGTYFKGTESTSSLTAKCVNWYWETDFDIFTGKGSVANVNTFIQGIFNQVSALYANDGISITLKTLFVWTSADPYTGPSTSDYLNQFGASRTSFDGDLATLIGYQGGGGIAWINGLCNSQTKYRMSYAGINSGYNTIPSYSWTVEVITHEQGHLLGSRHTHDCVWNGNNTKIDGCGDAAGYPSGSCAIPSPASPSGGGTVMSYCHLTSAGINFNLGFGPQPKALMINNINNASCLTNCSGCAVPDQPGSISGNNNVCSGSTQTYSVAAVNGATGYIWTLPPGWSGSSTTNSITVIAGTTAGNITITAINSCGSSTTTNLQATISTIPARPSIINGNTAVCTGTPQNYTAGAVTGAISYTWILPAGWTGSSATNSIVAIPGSAAGTIRVYANNGCGSGPEKTKATSITTTTPAQPGNITGIANVCQGSIQSYSVAAVPGASSYNWTFPNGWSTATSSNVVSVTVGTSSGNIAVAAINGCGSSASKILTSTVRLLPARPGAISVTGGAGACPGESRGYSIPSIAGLTYNWTAPTGSTIINGQGSPTINVTYNSNFVANGTIRVAASNSCGSGIERTITVARNVPASPGTISGAAVICPGSIVTYSIAAVAGALSYNWTIPAGAIVQGSSTANVISIKWGSTGGALAVRAVNACGNSGTKSLRITVNCSAPLVQLTTEKSAFVFPNPVVGFANIRFYTNNNELSTISIADMAGKKMITDIKQCTKGLNFHRINVNSLAKGIYIIIIENKKSRELIKIQIQ